MELKQKFGMVDSLFQGVNYVVMVIFTVICIYPFYYLFIYSISDSHLASTGIYLWPKGVTFDNYIRLLRLNDIGNAFLITVARTVIGTVVTLLCCTLFGYLLTKQEMPFRKWVYRFVIITMYFNAGLIPWYLTMKLLLLQNNFLLYILPSAVVAFYLILIKTYIESIPKEIEDSGKVDGAGTLTMYFRIILPLSMPIVATVIIFNAVGQWNSWVDNYFLVQNKNLQTLQLILLNYLRDSEMLANASALQILQKGQQHQIVVSSTTIRTTITMIVVAPIIIVYPFLQRFFVKGIMLGAVKG